MKSYVGMGTRVCPICYEPHTEEVLIHKQMKEVFESGQKVRTAWELCPKHKEMQAEYIALVEVKDEAHSPDDAQPTGNYLHIHREAAKHIFNIPLPDTLPFAYMEPGVIDKLKERMK